MASADICLFLYKKTIQSRELEFFQPGLRNLTFDTAGISRNSVRLPHITMAKRALDVASRELDREAAVHVQAHCLRSRSREQARG